jgi:signal transduction histidine kinase
MIPSVGMAIRTGVPPTLALKGHSYRTPTTVVFGKRKSCDFAAEGAVERRPPISEPGVVAHELSNDLSVIIRRCEMLGRLVKEPEMAKHLHLIREAAHHMADTIARASTSAGTRATHIAMTMSAPVPE